MFFVIIWESPVTKSSFRANDVNLEAFCCQKSVLATSIRLVSPNLLSILGYQLRNTLRMTQIKSRKRKINLTSKKTAWCLISKIICCLIDWINQRVESSVSFIRPSITKLEWKPQPLSVRYYKFGFQHFSQGNHIVLKLMFGLYYNGAVGVICY